MLLDRFHRRFHHSKHKGHGSSNSSEKSNNENKDNYCAEPMDTDSDLTLPVGQEQSTTSISQPIPLSLNCQQELYSQNYELEEDEELICVDPSVRTPMSTTPVNYGQTIVNKQENFDGVAGFGNSGPFPPYLHMQGRQNSVSSLASSISDFHGGLRQQAFANAAVGNSGNFTSQFLSLLMDVYQTICSDPTVTPFDTANPPSAILNKAAKITIEQCRTTGVEIGYERNSWLLTLVRHRLLEEVRKDGYLSRNNSNISLPPPPPQFMEMMNSTSFQSPNPTTPTNGQPDYFSKQSCNQEYFGSMLNMNSVNGRGNLMRSRSNSSQVLLARTRSNSNGLFALTPTSSENGLAAGFNGGLSLNTTHINHTNLLSRQRSSTAISASSATTPVMSCNPSTLDESTVFETLRKKRDSLRLKR